MTDYKIEAATKEEWAARALAAEERLAQAVNITERQLHEIAAVMWNIDKDNLEKAGAIEVGAVGGTCWERFDKNPLEFILKAPTEKRQALARLINARATT